MLKRSPLRRAVKVTSSKQRRVAGGSGSSGSWRGIRLLWNWRRPGRGDSSGWPMQAPQTLRGGRSWGGGGGLTGRLALAKGVHSDKLYPFPVRKPGSTATLISAYVCFFFPNSRRCWGLVERHLVLKCCSGQNKSVGGVGGGWGAQERPRSLGVLVGVGGDWRSPLGG